MSRSVLSCPLLVWGVCLAGLVLCGGWCVLLRRNAPYGMDGAVRFGAGRSRFDGLAGLARPSKRKVPVWRGWFGLVGVVWPPSADRE
jgi:hypothetical protein